MAVRDGRRVGGLGAGEERLDIEGELARSAKTGPGVLRVPPFDLDCRALDHQRARPEQRLLGASRQFGHDVGRGLDRVNGTGALT
jgi:hypothetical protein